MALTRRVVWLLPQPVRTAQMLMTGLLLFSCVSRSPSSLKSAPQALTRDALCMTSSYETSL